MHEFNCTVSAIFSAGVIDLEVHQETFQKEKEYTACTFGVPELWINKQAKIKGFGMLDGFMALLRDGSPRRGGFCPLYPAIIQLAVLYYRWIS